jgi:hypothetical protein
MSWYVKSTKICSYCNTYYNTQVTPQLCNSFKNLSFLQSVFSLSSAVMHRELINYLFQIEQMLSQTLSHHTVNAEQLVVLAQSYSCT